MALPEVQLVPAWPPQWTLSRNFLRLKTVADWPFPLLSRIIPRGRGGMVAVVVGLGGHCLRDLAHLLFILLPVLLLVFLTVLAARHVGWVRPVNR